MRSLRWVAWGVVLACAGALAAAALLRGGAAPSRPAIGPPGARLAAAGAPQQEPAPCPDPADPEQPCHLPPSDADRALGLGSGPPVYGRPAYAFGTGGWAKCAQPPQPGLSAWDGCDPFTGPAAYFHYDKPYGTPQDAVALVLWEPGRAERGYQGYQGAGGYFQSDRWDGPVSWNDGYYGGGREGHWCAGAYYQDVRYRDPYGEHPAPGFQDGRGYGGQLCS